MTTADTTFPKIPAANWWKLRDLFKKRVPAAVTPTYLSTALSMAESSARANLIGPFKKIGIIDDDGKPTDLAYDWRDDTKYPSVCETLLEKHYPQEIRDLFHTADVEFDQLTNWFMSHARCGEVAGKMYARFYMLLLKADPKGREEAETNSSTKLKKKARRTSKPKKSENVSVAPTPTSTQNMAIQTPAPINQTLLGKAPELHINIQLHISPESSADQIDKIFESMAKHLKEFSK